MSPVGLMSIDFTNKLQELPQVGKDAAIHIVEFPGNSCTEASKTVIYSYCKVSIYDPLCHKDFFEIQKIPSLKEPSQHPLNHSGVLKTVSCQVDASQVSWRRSKFLEDEVRFASPLTLNVDAALYGQMADKWGGCEGNEILGQYKAVFSDQLGAREKIYNTLETEND
mgnify:CR=1 FL=1